jgi:hypothetical protein
MALAAPAASFPANCCSQSGGAGAHLAHLPRAFREIIMFVAVPAAVGKHAQPAQRAFDQARGPHNINFAAPPFHQVSTVIHPEIKLTPPLRPLFAAAPPYAVIQESFSEERSLLAFLRALQIFSAVLRVNVPVFELAITLGSPR